MNMKCINFDEQFERYMRQWVKENEKRFEGNMDAMEEEMPEVYMRFINQKADWLDGETPAMYFHQFQDVNVLVGGMIEYFNKKIPVPDQLLERIVDMGAAAEERLMRLMTDKTAPYEAVLTAITLLRELDSTRPMQLYIDMIAQCPVAHEQADMCAESLRNMGDRVVEPILEVLPDATEQAQEVFLDILCNYPGDDRIYTLAARKFAENDDRRALFASYLGKLGDDRALPMLKEAAMDEKTNYLDYVEICNAIEELGGELPPEREFSGDPYYESLRQMAEK